MTKTNKDDAPQPMDPSVREAVSPEPSTNRSRPCWALQTLVTEFHKLFPETPVTFSGYDGRNTALDGCFDLTTLHGSDRAMAVALLQILTSDPRVSEVLGDEDQAIVSFHSSPRTQDLRDPFGLEDAFDILADEGEFEWGGGSL